MNSYMLTHLFLKVKINPIYSYTVVFPVSMYFNILHYWFLYLEISLFSI